ncbi:GntR family transcriptional regulator [Solihabitans fulvus]|uniref:GntR family transcriptional regulator n=1 Tax=Solihabitans fulvus TaxID=1892852 RepID=A0A5B2WZT2_9PSEU|nr:TetR/AcrR family transcriptional regulator C-terminal domain-containing protein [Solihabitans fulvus]KAA2255989.1 GntR family transcriptional regulator [Solihabitans fulvus]
METEAPYLRIVAELRARIARGELRPGERVPSTRLITREWGVAMATATKVIATLRDEGLVDTRPGAGTVVRSTEAGHGPAARKSSPRDRELSRDRVVLAAVAIADAEGLAMLSMRRVATELGVATMSLYRHVSSKDDLTQLMTEAVFAEHPLPARRPPGWRARLETAGRLMWSVFRLHPWAPEVLSMTRPRVQPSLIAYTEWTLGTLREMGFGITDMMHAHLTLFGHVRGLALNIHPEAQARQDTGMTNDEWMETQGAQLAEALAAGRFPAFEYVTQQDFDYDLDAVFEYGMQRLLDGIEARLRAVTGDRRGVAGQRRTP